MQKMRVGSLVWKDPLEKEMATHSSVLVWEIPQTEEPAGLQSMGHKKSDISQQINNNKPCNYKVLLKVFSLFNKCLWSTYQVPSTISITDKMLINNMKLFFNFSEFIFQFGTQKNVYTHTHKYTIISKYNVMIDRYLQICACVSDKWLQLCLTL